MRTSIHNIVLMSGNKVLNKTIDNAIYTLNNLF
jgi:hypothetical protein